MLLTYYRPLAYLTSLEKIHCIYQICVEEVYTDITNIYYRIP